MKYKLHRKFGIKTAQLWISQNEPEGEGDDNSGVVGGGTIDPEGIKNPQGLLNAKKKIQDERDQLKKELNSIKRKQAQAEDKQLADEKQWQQLLERKEAEYKQEIADIKASQDTELTKLTKQIETLTSEKTSLETIRQDLESKLSETELRQDVFSQIYPEMDSADAQNEFDYFWHKKGGGFKRGEDGSLLYSDQPFSIDTLKNDATVRKAMWKPIEAVGTNSEPGHETAGVQTQKGEEGVFTIDKALLSQPAELRRFMVSKNLDPAKLSDYLGTKIKVNREADADSFDIDI
jgi:hypothetical protein